MKPSFRTRLGVLLAAGGACLAGQADTSQPPPILAAPASYPMARHGGPYMWNYYIPPAPGSTPWAPCWSPDGRWIAVAMQGSIWKVDPRTGHAIELTTGTAYASSPAWSPDGKWIVYTADFGRKRIRLEAVELATGESHALTNDEHVYLDPAFSPDGGRLAYVSTEPNGYFNIYIRPIRDGNWAGEPVAITVDHSYARDRLYFGVMDMHIEPAWMPDGNELVFVSNRGVALGSGNLWRAPACPGAMAHAKALVTEQSLYRTRPHVSPDGKRIVYSSMAGGADQFHNLYVIPVDGGAPYKVTFGEHDSFHPRWSPDGEWIAYISNEDGLPQLCLLESWGGGRKKIRIGERAWKRTTGTLRIRVMDAANGKPTAARVHLAAADGRAYTPPDTYARVTSTGRDYFHTSGSAVLEAAAGPATLEVLKGFEYAPARQQVVVPEHGTASLTVVLHRIVDMPGRGWQSGSTHVHMNYGGNLHNTPENLALMAAAEDLHVVNAMAANKDNRVLDYQYFRRDRREYPLERAFPGVHVLFGEEYRPAFHGHAFLLGLRDHLISPYTGNYEATALDSLYPTNTDIFRKAKAQGAVTGYVHPFGDTDPLESGVGSKGFPVDVALGTLDCLEWSGAVKAQMGVWHRLLNNDMRLVPVGGEDSINDLHTLRTLGAIRTYVYTRGDVSASAWLDGIQKGRTFFSTGPLLDFRVNGELPGGSVRLPVGGGAVVLEGDVWSVAPLQTVIVYDRHGELRRIPLQASGNRAHFRERIDLKDSDWFSLAAQGSAYPLLDAAFMLAATNAVRVYVGERRIRDRKSAEYFARWIDLVRGQANQWPWWRSQVERDHVNAQYDEARRVYERLAVEADQPEGAGK